MTGRGRRIGPTARVATVLGVGLLFAALGAASIAGGLAAPAAGVGAARPSRASDASVQFADAPATTAASPAVPADVTSTSLRRSSVMGSGPAGAGVASAPPGDGPAPTRPGGGGVPTTAPVTAGAPAPAGSGTYALAAAASRGYAGSWGLYSPDFPGTLATIKSLQSGLGRTANYVMWYVHWGGPYDQPDTADLDAVAANGSVPVVTWMSDDPTGATTISDQEIAAGQYDGYLRTWASALRSTHTTVLLRFDHEMNGNWYGWSPRPGQTAADYVAAFRHVHDVFTAAGATNVKFVWSPNVDYPGASPLGALYPGDQYVDYVGIDGYNWGTLDGHTWQTPAQVFDQTLHEVAAITSRPLLITEVGCSPIGGDKASWITSFFSMLRSTPSIRGFIWFDAIKETDWTFQSTPADFSAFKHGLTGAS